MGGGPGAPLAASVLMLMAGFGAPVWANSSGVSSIETIAGHPLPAAIDAVAVVSEQLDAEVRELALDKKRTHTLAQAPQVHVRVRYELKNTTDQPQALDLAFPAFLPYATVEENKESKEDAEDRGPAATQPRTWTRFTVQADGKPLRVSREPLPDCPAASDLRYVEKQMASWIDEQKEFVAALEPGVREMREYWRLQYAHQNPKNEALETAIQAATDFAAKQWRLSPEDAKELARFGVDYRALRGGEISYNLARRLSPKVAASMKDEEAARLRLLDQWGLRRRFVSPFTGNLYAWRNAHSGKSRADWRDDSVLALLGQPIQLDDAEFIWPQGSPIRYWTSVAEPGGGPLAGGRTAPTLMRYRMEMAPSATSYVEVEYDTHTSYDRPFSGQGDGPLVFQFSYVLMTARQWKHFGPIDIRVSVPSNYLPIMRPAPASCETVGDRVVLRTRVLEVKENLGVAILPLPLPSRAKPVDSGHHGASWWGNGSGWHRQVPATEAAEKELRALLDRVDHPTAQAVLRGLLTRVLYAQGKKAQAWQSWEARPHEGPWEQVRSIAWDTPEAMEEARSAAK